MPDLRAYLEIRTAAPANFSPDGDALLVASNLSGTQQLYRVPRDGGGPEPVTDFAEPVGGAYLPTGRRILVTMDAGGNERHQILALDDDGANLERRVHDPDHIHRPGGVTRDGRLLAYASNRRDGVDFDVYLHRLDRPARPGGDELAFAPGGWCNPAGFSPDGRWLAVTRPTDRSLDNELWLVDVTGTEGAFEVAPHDDGAAVGPPRWRAGGSSFYFRTDIGRDRAAIARYDLAERRWDYALERDWEAACWIDWPGRTLLVTTNVDGYTRAELLDAETLAPRAEVELPLPGVASGWTFSRDGRRLAYQLSSALDPGDVWMCDTETGKSERLTESPCAVDKRTLVAPALHRYRSFDGESIPLFAYLPETGARAGRLPVVVMVHGGPEGQSRPLFNPLAAYLVANGYAVLIPNVRGSTGYGKRFHHLDDVRKRLDAVRDLEALHDWIGGHERLDPDRAALWGGSYGGYMVLSGLAYQPGRWAAGVDIVGVSNLATFLRNTSKWRVKMREREYGSLERDGEFLDRIAPLTHVGRMRAPLFMIHGANDPRVPLSETEQIHAALRKRGIRAELRVYRDEGHGLQKLANRLDAYPRAVAFLAEVLGPA